MVNHPHDFRRTLRPLNAKIGPVLQKSSRTQNKQATTHNDNQLMNTDEANNIVKLTKAAPQKGDNHQMVGDTKLMLVTVLR